jgi:hypothetical protein
VSECPDVPVPTPVLVEPRETRNGLMVFLFLGCDVEGRFKSDAGRGIFDGDEGGTTLDETPVPPGKRSVGGEGGSGVRGEGGDAKGKLEH